VLGIEVNSTLVVELLIVVVAIDSNADAATPPKVLRPPKPLEDAPANVLISGIIESPY
jgi:hypothetical protein